MTNTTAPTRSDPINERYYKPLDRADASSDWLFYVGAVLSLVIPFVDKTKMPVVYDGVHIAFIVVAGSLFVLGLAIRLYWGPGAEDNRRLDLLSNATGYRVALTHEQTVGYYNNNETDPIRRLGVAVMENSFFSRAIALEMAKFERIKVAIYLAMLVVVWLNRSTDMAVAAAVAQVMFSEQIISRFFRIEWFRLRCDSTFKTLHGLFQGSAPRLTLHAKVFEAFAYYETGKANAGITLSERVFLRRNPSLSAEWEQIKQSLRL
jgi:hypothetical protein